MLVWSTYSQVWWNGQEVYELQKQADMLYSAMHVLTNDRVKEKV